MDMRRVKQHKAQVDQYQDWSRLSTKRCKQYKDQVVFSGDPSKQNYVYMLFHYKGTGYEVRIPEAKYWCGCGLEERTDDVHIDLICFKGCFYLLTKEYNIRVLDAAYAYFAIQRQGSNCSRCYSAKELGGGMGNCIYFTNGYGLLSKMNCENELYCSLENDDWVIFRLNSDGSERFSKLAKKGKRSPIWLTAPLWWYFNRFRP
ncbi:hypothetical protein QYF36_000142 [Acer negundo]|nr:hypothetical protein QYF36_000142 [Acer negundo]